MFETSVTLAMIKEFWEENKTTETKPTQPPKGSGDICQSGHLAWKKHFYLAQILIKQDKASKAQVALSVGPCLKTKL